jgi:hypothetical protein
MPWIPLDEVSRDDLLHHRLLRRLDDARVLGSCDDHLDAWEGEHLIELVFTECSALAATHSAAVATDLGIAAKELGLRREGGELRTNYTISQEPEAS